MTVYWNGKYKTSKPTVASIDKSQVYHRAGHDIYVDVFDTHEEAQNFYRENK